MKNLILGCILLLSAQIQAQTCTQSVSFSLKEKVHQVIAKNFSPSNISSFELTVVPNPITSHLHINSTGSIKKLVLINSEGKIVKRVRLRYSKSFTIDTSSLPEGNYQVIVSHYGDKRLS